MSVALVDRTGFEVDAIDVFCGYGGSSQGIEAAGATIRAAANHSQVNLDCHAHNFPGVDHWQADLVDANDPQVINSAGKKVAGRYLDPADLPRARFAWFSPACTHHSQANATKIYERGLQLAMFEDDDWDEQAFVNSERSRVTMSCVLRYADRNHPEIICVENVLEVTKWGPARDGSSFRWWHAELRKLGYDTKLLFLNSMFFPPCPQSRDRLYIVAWRKGNTAPDLDYRPTAYCTSDACGGRIVAAVQSWKRATSAWMGLEAWGKYDAQYVYRCPDCRARVHPGAWMGLTAIDWSNLGPTLGERIAGGKRPAATTWERIRRAMAKYLHAPPIVLPQEVVAAEQVHTAHAETVSTSNTGSAPQHHGNRSRSIAEQLPTLAQRNTVGIAIDGAMLPIRSGRPRADHMADPTAAIMADGSRLALALTVKNNGGIDEAGYRGHHAVDPLGAIVGSSRPQSVLALLVPNRTNNVANHAAGQLDPVMTSATEAVVIAAAGNTSERAGQTRARSSVDQLFTQGTTAEFGMAAMPVFRSTTSTQETHPAESMSTVSAGGGHHALATAMIQKQNGDAADTTPHLLDEPLRTITGRDTTGLVIVPWIDQWISDPVHVTEQLAALTARMRHTLASCPPATEPITDEQMMEVRFRMLEPDPELKRGMAFHPGYVLLGTKTQKTAGLGNAVTPPPATWITGQCLATLR